MTRYGSKGYRPVALSVLSLLLAGGVACDSATHDEDSAPAVAVLVANQGNFSDGNGSVTRYDPETGEVVTLLAASNSIIQSIAEHNGLLYVAMNTGDRIDIIDPSEGVVGQITDVPSPRYMAWSDDSHLLVTSLYENAVTILNLTAGSVAGSVAVGLNPEGILVQGTEAFVANHAFGEGKTVSVIGLSSLRVERTLELDCDGPRFVFADRQEDLWVVCTGQTLYDDSFNVIGTTDGAVLIVDPVTGETLLRFDLEGMVSTPGPGQDAFYSGEAESLFVVVDAHHIMRFDTAENRQIDSIGPLPGSAIGAVAFDAHENLLYVGRVPGFTVAGQVSVLALDGSSVEEFAAGVAPSHIEIVRTMNHVL